jgi:hypothetical protein
MPREVGGDELPKYFFTRVLLLAPAPTHLISRRSSGKPENLANALG